jgi:hypothetical protein
MPQSQKPIDRWLALGGIVLGIVLFLVPKSPVVVGVLLGIVFLLMVHPIWTFWWMEDYLPRRIAGLIALATVLTIAGFTIPMEVSPVPPKPELQYPPPKGPLIRVDGNTPLASSQMCLGLSGEQLLSCFCPRQLDYSLKALAPPQDDNYATEMAITQPPDQFQHLRVFLRATASSVHLIQVVPDDKTQNSVTTLGLMDYDRASFVIQSTARKILYKVVMHSSEQMHVICVSYEN